MQGGALVFQVSNLGVEHCDVGVGDCDISCKIHQPGFELNVACRD